MLCAEICVFSNSGLAGVILLFSTKCLDFFGTFLGPPGAGNGPKMWPRGPAFERRSIVQIRPMAARFVAKVRFAKHTAPPLLDRGIVNGGFSRWGVRETLFGTSRAAIGRIWTILRRSKAGPRGHILGPFPAPGGASKRMKKCKKRFGRIPKCLNNWSQPYKPEGRMDGGADKPVNSAGV